MSAKRLLVIGRRFRGPPTSGNGGYTCGMLAAAASQPVELRLIRPPPLEVPLEIAAGAHRLELVSLGGGSISPSETSFGE